MAQYYPFLALPAPGSEGIRKRRHQDHERDGPVGFLLVLSECRIPFDDHCPEALAFSRTYRLGGHFELLTAHFDRRPWVREQVVVPVRVRRRATLRRNDNVAVAIAEVRQRVRPPLPGLRTGVSEKQERLSCEG